MVEACPVCDTLWRLYGKATENLQEIAAKHREAREKGDQKSVEPLAHEVAIAESVLPVIRRELRRHETTRHNDKQKPSQSKDEGQNQKQQ